MPTSSTPEENALDNMGSVSNTETRRPSPTPIPDEAVRLGTDEAHRQLGEPLENAMDLVAVRQRVEAVLQAAYPAILADLCEHLLGDEAVEAVAKARWDRGWLDPNGMADWDEAKRRGMPGVAKALKEARADLEAALSEVTG